MKRKILMMCILPLLLCSGGISNGTIKDIYTISNGNIVTKTEFIKPLYDGKYTNLTPYKEKISIPIKSKNNQYQYNVKLSLYNNWEDELGDYSVIEIMNNGQTICSIKNDATWVKLVSKYKPYSDNDYFIPIALSDSSTALIFVGFLFPTEQPDLTIIVIDKNSAKLVFNQEMRIDKIAKTDTVFSMNLQAKILEEISDPGIKHRIWSENGVLKFENL